MKEHPEPPPSPGGAGHGSLVAEDMGSETHFAAAARLSAAQVLVQLESLRAEPGTARTLDAIPTMVAVLNAERQVVFANTALLEAAGGTGGIEGLCGGRPGEVLGCLHATEGPGGCGTSESCRFCGAASAILEALRTGEPAARTCRITTRVDKRLGALDLAAEVVPFRMGAATFLFLSLRDIAPRLRRAAVERVFFHDILNSISGLKVHLDLLRAKQASPETQALVDRAETILASLVEEIRGQKTLLAAENGSLRVQRNLIAASEIVGELIAQVGGETRDRTLAVAAFSEPVSFVSDASLVRRILLNMIINALEASPPGATITLGFRPLPGKAEGGPGQGSQTGRPVAGGMEFGVHNPGSMSEEARHQVFQRSFSTKGDGRGLGTWSMRLLAEEYLGGSVSFTSDAGGTTFVLSLPLALPMKP